MSYGYLLDLALILLSTKVLSLVTKRFKLPQVVGALLAGLILGPAVFNVIDETDFIKQLAEVGVIVLLFTAGLESNLSEFKKSGKTSFIVATMGVIIPLIGGTILAYCINDGKVGNVNIFVQNIFIGSVLTATSVSITVETLRELGKVSTSVGNIIVGAAIIDDVLGMLVLTVITSLADSSVSVVMVAFFIFSVIVGIITYKLFNKWVDKYDIDKRRFVIVSFVICLLLSFSAEKFFGVADITGAYIAGLVLSSNKETIYITKRFETLSYILLSPVFFASVGLNVKLPYLNGEIVMVTIALIIVAVLTKIIGCGLGAKLCGYNNMESIQIGSGMVTRGEVTLIIASKGLTLGLISSYFLAPIIIMVVFTSIFTPILLKIVFSRDKSSVQC